MKPHIQNLHISDVAKFCGDLVKNLFMCLTNIDEQVEDKYAKAIISSYGCQAAIIKRLNDNKYDWVGSICCEFLHPIDVSEEEARQVLHEAAMTIQYLLPEFK